MTVKEYALAAIDMVITIALEQNIKYRRGDFCIQGEERKMGDFNNVMYIGSSKNPTGITITLNYNFERCGKKIKAVKDEFYAYKYCRVTNIGIIFAFSINEIIIQSTREEKIEKNKIDVVIRKVQKLLALADKNKNPSEAEAISASMQAQKLLAKYNIDIANITGEQKDEPIEQVIADVGVGKKWKYALANIVAESYCCECFYCGVEMIVFYGFSSDVLIARRVFMYLFKVGNTLANKYVRRKRENEELSTNGLYNSFCSGFCNGVEQELKKNCTALMLVTPKKVVESFEKFSETFKTRDDSISAIDKEAYTFGEIEGKRALNAQYIEGE